jgi:lipid A disaccharide synthetase
MWMVRVFFSVGDASGDMYAASVARAVKQLRNSWVLEGIGGSEMLKAGVKLLRYTTPFSAFGFWSALQTSVRFWALTAWRVRSVLMRNPPDLFVPVDLGAFNRRLLLPLAEKGAKVFYFVPPSFWGVNPERLRKYAHPNIVFAPIYQWQSEKLKQSGAQVIEFGHPLADIMQPYRSISTENARASLRLHADQFLVGLFPGSRLTTVKENLPLLLQAARLLTRLFPKIHFAIGLPEDWRTEWVKPLLKRYDDDLPLTLLFGQVPAFVEGVRCRCFGCWDNHFGSGLSGDSISRCLLDGAFESLASPLASLARSQCPQIRSFRFAEPNPRRNCHARVHWLVRDTRKDCQ